MLKIHSLFLKDISLIINQHSFLFKNSRETKNKQWKPDWFSKNILEFVETVLFSNFLSLKPRYTDLEKYFSQSGNNTELIETYRSCLAKGELLVILCKINHDQVSAEQKLGLTKVRLDLFLMLIHVNPIASTLTVPYGTMIPKYPTTMWFSKNFIMD